MADTARLIGYDARYKATIRFIDSELDNYSAARIYARYEQVLRAAAEAFGTQSADYRAVRDAWDYIFPAGEYSRANLAAAMVHVNT